MATNDDTPLPATRKAAQASGSMFYAPGSSCPAGHVAKRRTSNGMCFGCEQSPEFRRKAVQKLARWRKAIPLDEYRSMRAAQAREARRRNPDRERAKGRRQRNKMDPVKRAAILADWRKRNKDKTRRYANAYQKAWRAANPVAASVKSSAADYRRRAREQGAVGKFTACDIAWLMAEQGGKCAGFWCEVVFNDDFTIDHRDPISRGGTNWPDNLALLCKSCNSRKNDKTMPEWFHSLGGYFMTVEFYSDGAFTVKMPDGRSYNIPRGRSELPDDVAGHPFVLAHATGIPKGRMPLVEGRDHDGKPILIQADEAGQRVTAPYMNDPMSPPTRQEGDVSWHRGPAEAEAAAVRAEAVGAPVLPYDAAANAQPAYSHKPSPNPPASAVPHTTVNVPPLTAPNGKQSGSAGKGG